MIEKSNRTYILCQAFAFIFLFLVIQFAKTLGEQTNEINTFKDYLGDLIQIFFDFILMSHFITRKQLKRKVNNISVLWIILLISSAVFMSTATRVILDFMNHLVISDVHSSNIFVVEEKQRYSQLLKMLAGGFLLHTIWLVAYLTITSVRDKQTLAQQLAEQRLSSLTAQINPHFLFNSLNTIRGMIFEDKNKAAELVGQLSDLFRYNLASDKSGTITLAKELDVCEQYLAIEHVRLGERLKVKLLIDDDALKIKIPTMTLLTLVENAIKHGISKLKSGGQVTIETKINNNFIIIKVTNPYEAQLVEAGTQIGLNNIKQRVDLMYGSKGSVSQTDDNGSFLVKLTLPI